MVTLSRMNNLELPALRGIYIHFLSAYKVRGEGINT